MTCVAFVGDVHGELVAMRALIRILRFRDVEKVIFLGDYLNKGASGPAVVDELIELSKSGYALCLRGNHETGLLDCLESRDARTLLRMSGAPTIRAYVGRDVGPDVTADLVAAVPASHVDFLRGLADKHETEEYIASHVPIRSPDKYVVSAHVDVGLRPRLLPFGAAIDTGCGSPGGVLTGLLWPSLDYVQVNTSGATVPNDHLCA